MWYCGRGQIEEWEIPCRSSKCLAHDWPAARLGGALPWRWVPAVGISHVVHHVRCEKIARQPWPGGAPGKWGVRAQGALGCVRCVQGGTTVLWYIDEVPPGRLHRDTLSSPASVGHFHDPDGGHVPVPAVGPVTSPAAPHRQPDRGRNGISSAWLEVDTCLFPCAVLLLSRHPIVQIQASGWK